jgi:peptidoglycan/LPS O-acetylase OafA/YrhL
MVGSRRLRELDALRGIAALYVLLHHNLIAAGPVTGWVADVLDMTPLRGLTNGRPAVLFFFVLSGYVLTRALRGSEAGSSARGYAGWIAQRVARLGLPALAALLVSVVLYRLTYAGTWQGESWWLRDVVWQTPPTPALVARHALLLVPDHGFALDNVLWSLVQEWRLSLLLPAIAAAAVFAGRQGAIRLVLVGVAVTGIMGGHYGESYGLGQGVLSGLRATLYFTLPFMLGAALERADIASLPADRWTAATGFLAVLALGRVGTDLAVFAASGLLIWLAQQPGALRRALQHPALTWLGTASFSLYLVHVPVLAALHHTLHARLPAPAIALMALAAALPAAWLFYLAVERPVQRLARAIGQATQANLPRPARHAPASYSRSTQLKWPPLPAPVSRNTASPPAWPGIASGRPSWLRRSWPTYTVSPAGMRSTQPSTRSG